nr:hypothetical protein [Comamonas thiooxydans]
MRHFLLLLVLGIGCYVAWSAMSAKEKEKAASTSRKHLRIFIPFLLVLLAGLVLAVYTRAINII